MFKSKNTDDITVTEVTISTETLFKLALFVLGLLFLLWSVRKITHALLLIFVAFFLTLALNSPVQTISRRIPGKLKGNRLFATGLSFLIVVILFAAFAAYIIPPLVKQTESFINATPQIIQDFKGQKGEVGSIIRRYRLGNEVSTISNQLSARLHNIGGSAYSAVTQIGKSVFSVVTILVLTFMMLSEGARWVEFTKDLIPDKRHHLVDRISHDMYLVIRGFVNGQVTLAALASVLITPALFILHVGYPVALIVVIFICGLIPMVGHTIGAIIVTTVALFHSTSAGIIILAYYLLYQQFENYIIQPKIQANSTNMSPLLVFVSLIIGINFGGLFGGLLAIPVAGCIRIAILEYLGSKNIIGDSSIQQPNKVS
jgi:predicted PurR-regulated permease PerM